MSNDGYIELSRAVDSILVPENRIREDMGDIAALCDSIARIGLLQPIAITPEGTLLCGQRRLTAIKRLGWQSVKVWVRSGIDSELERLLAEQDENVIRKDFTPVELAKMYKAVRDAEAAEVKAKQARTQFGRSAVEDEADGYGKFPEPVVLRDLATRRLTGKGSYHTFDRVLEIEELSQNPDVPEGLRALAATQLEEVRTTKHVTTPYAVVKKEEALLAIATALASEGLPTTFEEELAIRRHQLETAVGSVKIMAVAKAALKRANEVRKRKGNDVAELVVGRQPPRDPARWVPRALLAIVGDTDYWWLHLDPAEVGSAMKLDQWEQFEDWVHNAVEFRNAARPFRQG